MQAGALAFLLSFSELVPVDSLQSLTCVACSFVALVVFPLILFLGLVAFLCKSLGLLEGVRVEVVASLSAKLSCCCLCSILLCPSFLVVMRCAFVYFFLVAGVATLSVLVFSGCA